MQLVVRFFVIGPSCRPAPAANVSNNYIVRKTVFLGNNTVCDIEEERVAPA